MNISSLITITTPLLLICNSKINNLHIIMVIVLSLKYKYFLGCNFTSHSLVKIWFPLYRCSISSNFKPPPNPIQRKTTPATSQMGMNQTSH